MEYNEHANTGTNVSMSNSGNFEDYEFVPAVIIENKDPLNYGRIKVSAPGMFNGNNTDLELLPWCYPWMMFGQAAYSTMEKGAKVWVIRNEKRLDECWYVPMYELHAAAQEFINEHANEKPEIMSFRNVGSRIDSLTYDNAGSFNFKCGETSVNISGGGIQMTDGNNEISVSNNGIVSLGPNIPGDLQSSMILGKTLKIKLTELGQLIISLLNEIIENVPEFNQGYAAVLIDVINQWIGSLDLMLSESVMINESNEEKARAAASGC